VPTLASSQTCPACGAPLAWRSAAPYTVCSHCQSLLVRRDASVENIGRVAQVPDDFSPFQLGTTGTFERHHFALVGRLRKSWDQGSWNEWCAALDDGRFGWLAEAQGDLVMTFAQGPAGPAPAGVADLTADATWTIGGASYVVTDRKEVSCTGAEGELARGGLDTGPMTSIDLRGPELRFATWEIAGDRAQLFVGRFVEFEECRFTQLRVLEGWGGAAAGRAP